MALSYCPACGAQLTGNAQWCANCGAPIAAQPASTPTEDPTSNAAPAVGVTPPPTPDQNQRVCPENHLTKAILVTILCCWPLGIPAIINASGVSEAFMAGNYELAEEKSAKAAKWIKYCMIAGGAYVALTVLCSILYTILIVVLGEL